MFSQNRILTLVTLLSGLVAVEAWAVTVRFEREATVTDAFVTLGDVASISNGSPEEIERLQHVRLAPSPPLATEIHLGFDAIRGRLQASGFSTAHIDFLGPSRIRIRRSGVATAAETIPEIFLPKRGPTPAEISRATQAVASVIRKRLAAYDPQTNWSNVEIQIRLKQTDVRSLLAVPRHEWAISGWAGGLDDPQNLLLTSKSASRSFTPIPIACQIRRPPMVVTVRQTLTPGHVLRPSDLTWMPSSNGQGATRMEDVVGMETKQTLRPGSPINAAALQKKPYIRPRDIVTVYARNGGITVKRMMRALQGGGLGDTIPVVSLKGKDRFDVRITGYHETEVLDSEN